MPPPTCPLPRTPIRISVLLAVAFRPAAMVGTVGDDDFGRVNLDRLRRDGVDVSAIRIDPDAPTGSAFVRYRPDGQRDFVFNIRQSAAAKVSLTPQANAAIAAAAHLHIVGSSLISPAMTDTILTAAERIKAKGGTISFDPSIRRELAGMLAVRRQGPMEGVSSEAELAALL